MYDAQQAIWDDLSYYFIILRQAGITLDQAREQVRQLLAARQAADESQPG